MIIFGIPMNHNMFSKFSKSTYVDLNFAESFIFQELSKSTDVDLIFAESFFFQELSKSTDVDLIFAELWVFEIGKVLTYDRNFEYFKTAMWQPFEAWMSLKNS